MKAETPLTHLLDLPPWFDTVSAEGLIWLEGSGIGFCRKRPATDLYAQDYWNEFRRRDASEIGAKLTAARIEFVRRHTDTNDIVDIGIGGGRFAAEMPCFGYDVNEEAISWLRQQNRWRDPTLERSEALTLWDSVEHSLEWRRCFRTCLRWIFISTPIYESSEHCKTSRHFKPTGEHQLYMTERGLKSYMQWHGFKIVARDDFENKLGRDGIGTFSFRRVGSPPKHGMSRSKTWLAWKNMRRRCSDPKDASYDRYGARGITVCDRWFSFENFLSDMGEAPAGLTLERNNPNGNYGPSNCRWASQLEQQRNRTNNVLIEANGERLTLSQWTERLGCAKSTIRQRLAMGWDPVRAVTTPGSKKKP